MSRLFSLFSCLCLALCLTLTGCQSSEPTLYTVDVERILSVSKGAQQANEHLAKVQAILQEGLEKYKAELEAGPEETRNQDMRNGLEVINRQLVIERNAARAVVSKCMIDQINVWRESRQKITVIARQNVLAAPASIDITNEIISLMDAVGPLTFNDLPKVVINRRDAAEQAAQQASEEAAQQAPAEAAPTAKKPAAKK